MIFFFRKLGAVLTLTIAVICLPTISRAAVEERQQISLTINSNYTADARWTLPVLLSNAVREFSIPEFKSYGTAASTNYKLISVQNHAKENIPFRGAGDQVIVFDPGYKNTTTARFPLYFNYTLTPAFKEPVAIYEVWMADGTLRQSPILSVPIPLGWKLISSWPEGKVEGNTLTVEYPITELEPRPMMLVFETPGAGVVETVGKYTVAGSASDVQKIKAALLKLPDVDLLMQQTIGIEPPKKVTIVAEDLSKAGAVGHDALAIAANPNLMILNNQLAKSSSVEELAETIAHELVHLAMNSNRPFQGRYYAAPWFDEGLPVYFENVVHEKIFTEPNHRILIEELNRTPVVSPQGARALYESAFDYSFDGSNVLGTSASYRHAGLTFAMFADKSGVEGFKKLFANIKNSNPTGIPSREADLIFDAMQSISGLTRDQLQYPGKKSGTVDSVVGRISRPENDADASAVLVTDYIQNRIKHYFGASGVAAVPSPTTTTPVNPPTTSNPTSGSLKTDFGVGSKGSEVIILQSFLEAKGFLKMPPGVAKGSFGNLTKIALQAYQKSQGINSTGYVGPKTRAAINSTFGQ